MYVKPSCFNSIVYIRAVFLYYCPDCISCPASANQMGEATWGIWGRIKKYTLSDSLYNSLCTVHIMLDVFNVSVHRIVNMPVIYCFWLSAPVSTMVFLNHYPRRNIPYLMMFHNGISNIIIISQGIVPATSKLWCFLAPLAVSAQRSLWYY